MRKIWIVLAATSLAVALAAPAPAEEKHHPEASPPKAQPERPAMRPGMMGADRCEPGTGMMCMMGQHMRMGEPMMERRAERHLAALKAELKITDAQTKAWDGYAAAVLAAAKAMADQRKAMMDKAAASTLPQRLDLHEAMLVSHLEQLRKTKIAAAALYAVLSGDQKKIADKAALGMMHGSTRAMQMRH